jgi:AAA domain
VRTIESLEHELAELTAERDRLHDLVDDDGGKQEAIFDSLNATDRCIRRVKLLRNKRAARSVRDREADRLWALRSGKTFPGWDPRVEFRPKPLVVPETWMRVPDAEWIEKHGLPRQERELARLGRLEKKGKLDAEMERLIDEARDLMKWSFQDREAVRIQAARIAHGGTYWEFPEELRQGIAVADLEPYLRDLLLSQHPDAAPDELWDVEGSDWYRVGRLTHDEVVEAVTAERPRFRLYSAEELDTFPPVEFEYELDGYLARGELTGFYGPGGSKKSFVAQAWASHLANAGLTVLYVAAEGASGLQDRFAAWKQDYSNTTGFASHLDTLMVMPAPIRMQDGKDVAAFIEAVEAQLGEYRPVLVVIDTLGRNFVGGDENSAKDMGLFVEGAEQIRRKWSTAVIVIHHTTKDGSSERGSQALRNASFAMFKFSSSGPSVTVECDRMKDAPEPRPVHMRMELVEFPSGEEARSSLVAPWPFGEQAVSMVDLAANAGADDMVWGAKVEKVYDVIRQYGPISTNQWLDLVRGLSTRDKNDAGGWLRDAGRVQVEKGPRNALLWSAVEPDADLDSGGYSVAPGEVSRGRAVEGKETTSTDLDSDAQSKSNRDETLESKSTSTDVDSQSQSKSRPRLATSTGKGKKTTSQSRLKGTTAKKKTGPKRPASFGERE